MKSDELTKLEKTLGHRFRDRELLKKALTHRSHAHESAIEAPELAGIHNEQLEFLGDAVLGFVTSQTLFEQFPEYSEGQLSKLRAFLVSAQHLQAVAKRLQLGEFLRLGRGEEKSGGREKAALLVDATEAVLAALYLDGGLEAARPFIQKKILASELKRLRAHPEDTVVMDFKSALQESLQAQGMPQPRYHVVREHGPDHAKIFTVELRIQPPNGRGGERVTRASASSKKQAEQKAAKTALDRLRPPRAGSPEGGSQRVTGRLRTS
jgi:ribonuclease-3